MHLFLLALASWRSHIFKPHESTCPTALKLGFSFYFFLICSLFFFFPFLICPFWLLLPLVVLVMVFVGLLLRRHTTIQGCSAFRLRSISTAHVSAGHQSLRNVQWKRQGRPWRLGWEWQVTAVYPPLFSLLSVCMSVSLSDCLSLSLSLTKSLDLSKSLDLFFSHTTRKKSQIYTKKFS